MQEDVLRHRHLSVCVFQWLDPSSLNAARLVNKFWCDKVDLVYGTRKTTYTIENEDGSSIKWTSTDKGGGVDVVHSVDVVYSNKHRLVCPVPSFDRKRRKIQSFYPNGKKNKLETYTAVEIEGPDHDKLTVYVDKPSVHRDISAVRNAVLIKKA